MADIQVFQNVDAAKWQRIKDLLIAKVNIAVTTDEGEAEAKGFDIAWKYDPVALTLETTLEKHPWFEPASVIDADMKQWINAA